MRQVRWPTHLGRTKPGKPCAWLVPVDHGEAPDIPKQRRIVPCGHPAKIRLFLPHAQAGRMRCAAPGAGLFPSGTARFCMSMDGCPATDTTATDWAPLPAERFLPSHADGWNARCANSSRPLRLVPGWRRPPGSTGSPTATWLSAAERSAELRHRLGKPRPGATAGQDEGGALKRYGCGSAVDQLAAGHELPGAGDVEDVRVVLQFWGSGAYGSGPAWRCARPRRRGAGCRWTGCRRVLTLPSRRMPTLITTTPPMCRRRASSGNSGCRPRSTRSTQPRR